MFSFFALFGMRYDSYAAQRHHFFSAHNKTTQLHFLIPNVPQFSPA